MRHRNLVRAVKWHVLTEPVTVDAKLVGSFKALFGPNARPVQPLHDRDLLVDTSAG